ncbi:class II peroxidase [Tilletiaria anomala UBC 951]|uniref:Peroxidase n=1 Tax=Tilletiaria anomala (strain ATCC 24038 / CBS 436.72 / UBC 951) TaxID=1037660 RepID=A0A066VT28_TILAU|nr:class II peroxidase [Tilletiaria anomala UBC 951]KDN41964.1 class II peroxidase [Tilletiaria anomala UBC 951]
MAALRTVASTSLRSTLRPNAAATARRSAQAPSLRATRNLSSSRIVAEQQGPVKGSPPPAADSGVRTNRTALFGGLAIAVLAGGAFAFFGDRDDRKNLLDVGRGGAQSAASWPKDGLGSQQDYQKVYNAISERLEIDPKYDDGSYGPVLVRLAWHSSGTYDKHTNTGGSNGATMRFAPESNHGANAGLKAARDFLEPIKQQFPWVTYSDLWTLGGVVAIQELGGPKIPWRPGRSDREANFCPPEGRLPDADKGSDHLRWVFYKMGFNDEEIVALSGAHALGRCHSDRSGFDGPWQHSPLSFNNEYFTLLLNEKWHVRKWDGPKQFQDASTGGLMMLPTDMALLQDKKFRKQVEKYAKNEELFFKDFQRVFSTLLELGVPQENFKRFEPVNESGKPYMLKTTAEQENA